MFEDCVVLVLEGILHPVVSRCFHSRILLIKVSWLETDVWHDRGSVTKVNR